MSRPAEKCATCARRPREGCSHVDCPHRRPETARVPDHLEPTGEGRYQAPRGEE
jgi:hypothetical protein